jgi:hypothetical protein
MLQPNQPYVPVSPTVGAESDFDRIIRSVYAGLEQFVNPAPVVRPVTEREVVPASQNDQLLTLVIIGLAVWFLLK